MPSGGPHRVNGLSTTVGHGTTAWANVGSAERSTSINPRSVISRPGDIVFLRHRFRRHRAREPGSCARFGPPQLRGPASAGGDRRHALHVSTARARSGVATAERAKGRLALHRLGGTRRMCFKHPIVISKRALLAPFHIPTDPSWVPEWHAYVARRIYFSGKFIFGADFKNATRKAIWAPAYGGRSVDFVRGASPPGSRRLGGFLFSGRPLLLARLALGLWGSRSRPCPREPSGRPSGLVGGGGSGELFSGTSGYLHVIYIRTYTHT